MHVGVLGISHKTAELALREELARAASDAFAGQRALFFPHPTVLLSTCNRTEIYFSADDLSAAHSDVLALLRPFEHRLYSLFGVDCVAHLTRVASGLDSAIVAESDIQRQVRVAYEAAARSRTLSPCMHYMFQKAFKVSKAVRTRLLHGHAAPSVQEAVWRMIHDLHPAKILLVGHSATNREIGQLLARQGVEFALVTREPAQVRLAHCRALPRAALVRWQEYDVVVAATQADGYLIAGTSAGHHVLFDLSVPRVVDPRLAQQEGVRLYNIEDIQRWSARSGADELVSVCEELVWHEAGRLTRLYRERALAMSNSSVSCQ